MNKISEFNKYYNKKTANWMINDASIEDVDNYIIDRLRMKKFGRFKIWFYKLYNKLKEK
jgi:hypothetical protein